MPSKQVEYATLFILIDLGLTVTKGGNNIVVFDSNQNSMSFKSSFNRGLAFEPVGEFILHDLLS